MQPLVSGDSLVSVDVTECGDLFAALAKFGASLQKLSKRFRFLTVDYIVFVRVELVQVPLGYSLFHRQTVIWLHDPDGKNVIQDVISKGGTLNLPIWISIRNVD